MSGWIRRRGVVPIEFLPFDIVLIVTIKLVCEKGQFHIYKEFVRENLIKGDLRLKIFNDFKIKVINRLKIN